MTNMPKRPRRADLTATSEQNRIELSEEQLIRVVGGSRKAGSTPVEYLKIKLEEVIITSVS